MSKRSQPGMIGGLMGIPVECSTGPGTPMPMPMRSSTGRPRLGDERASPSSSAQSSTGSGPSAMRERGATRCRRIVPARSAMATTPWVAPRSMATTMRDCGLKAMRAGGRPPVETSSPAGLTGRWPSGASMRVGDRRAGEAGQLGELGAGARHAVAQDRQQRRGFGRDEGRSRTMSVMRSLNHIASPAQLKMAIFRRLLIDNRQKSG